MVLRGEAPSEEGDRASYGKREGPTETEAINTLVSKLGRKPSLLLHENRRGEEHRSDRDPEQSGSLRPDNGDWEGGNCWDSRLESSN